MLRGFDSLGGREQRRLKARLGGILLDEYAAQKKSSGNAQVRVVAQMSRDRLKGGP